MLLTPEEAKKLAAEILDEPEGGFPPPASRADPRPLPERIGNYRILGIIATGGMGVVYEAQQDHPRRSVALKVMKLGIASPKALERFKHEAEILGRLRHPAIAQIFEAGTHDDGSGGVPFFAMEYIPNAKPITRYADDRKLPTRDRLELFAQVCDGIHHGHQKGIIHRDLKPHNILVDETGQPKIIDFGVARATDSDITLTTMHADVRQLLGTLQYMSPEQCTGDPHEIDVRSDVYSLGVVLYELLCGRLPYDLANTPVPHATRLIQERDPPRPSMILRSLRGNIEAIVLKALEKAPKRRYQSAADLARDIRRHLAGDPIDARAPSSWSRAIHWLARHALVTTAAACSLIASLMIVASYLTVWQLNQRPHHVERTSDGREVLLLSYSGKVLDTWSTSYASGISFAAFRTQPRELGGRQLVLIGYNPIQEDENVRGALCAFDASGDRHTPMWAHRISHDETLAVDIDKLGLNIAGFGVCWGRLFDVFPDLPGLEIVVSYTHSKSSVVALRVLDLRGRLLYQIWHDGGLYNCEWMGSRGLLFLCGLNSEVYWPLRGHDEVKEVHPRIVFAVRPLAEHVGTGWTSPSPGSDTATLAWYKCLLPPTSSDIVGDIHLVQPNPRVDQPHSVGLVIGLRGDTGASLTMFLDENGVELSGTRGASDEWKLRSPVDHGYLYLGDLPPIVPAARDANQTQAPPGG